MWMMVSGSFLHRGHSGSKLIPLAFKQTLTPILLWKHFQRKNWILGFILSFHIQWPLKTSSPSFGVANLYALERSNLPWEFVFQANLSSLLIAMAKGVVWTSNLMLKGRSKEILSQFQALFMSTSSLLGSLHPYSAALALSSWEALEAPNCPSKN